MAKYKNKTSAANMACRLIQQYARLNETDDNGWGHCVSCGNTVHYKDGHGGHFHPKGRHYNGACLDIDNVHLQCDDCNSHREEGNTAGYARYMVSRYGKKIFNELLEKSYKLLTKEDFEEAIEKYRRLNRELIKKKTFKIELARS